MTLAALVACIDKTLPDDSIRSKHPGTGGCWLTKSRAGVLLEMHVTLWVMHMACSGQAAQSHDSLRTKAELACRAGQPPEGYQPLPSQGAWAVGIKQQQEDFAADVEKALMETYNALYKLQDCIPLVRVPPPILMHLQKNSGRTYSNVQHQEVMLPDQSLALIM